MPLCFRKVRCVVDGLTVQLDLSFEDGLIVGVTGPNGSGKSALLRLAAGNLQPDSGVVEGFETSGIAEASLESAHPGSIRESIDSLLEAAPHVLLVGSSFALTDLAFQNESLATFHQLRRRGAIIVLASQDLSLLERHCDEVVVMEQGRVQDRGNPQQVLTAYRARLLEQMRGASAPPELHPASRHGDGRARVLNVEIMGASGEPTAVVQSGEEISVRVRLAFEEAVGNPVVGMLIRSRIGINVYGTNTELEKANFGPCAAGDEVEVRFSFGCNLCPEQYTLTVASHDPDGTAHEWLEEAISFTVADTRYTTGVANLRAQVEVKKRR